MILALRAVAGVSFAWTVVISVMRGAMDKPREGAEEQEKGPSMIEQVGPGVAPVAHTRTRVCSYSLKHKDAQRSTLSPPCKALLARGVGSSRSHGRVRCLQAAAAAASAGSIARSSTILGLTTANADCPPEVAHEPVGLQQLVVAERGDAPILLR